MLKTRIIPCLDVKDGRVVKGINFVDLVGQCNKEHIELVNFSHNDIERHPAVTEVLSIYGDND